MSLEWFRQRSCTCKISYSTRKLAKLAVKSMHCPTSAMNVYLCEFCGLWHIGHKNKNFANKLPPQ